MKQHLSFAIALAGLTLTVHAGDLLDLSPEKALNFHKFRMENITTLYDRETIAPSSRTKDLPRDLKANKTIDKEISKTDLLSVMKWDGEKVVIDSLNDKKLKNTDKMYSFSMAKSFTGYLAGEAVCSGLMDLQSPMSTYIPETSGTLYGSVTLGNMLDMAAGDSVIYTQKRSPEEYNGLLMKQKPEERQTALDVLRSRATGVTSDTVGKFRYSDAITDLIARALDTSTPEGLGKFFHEKLAEPSGTASDMFYLIDSNGWPLLHGYLHATREDFMRMAIRISESWRSDSCIGEYLRTQYTERIQAGNDLGKSYGGQFWFDSKYGGPDVALMNGFGGQHIYLNMKTGEILSMHAIRPNYDEKKVVKAAFN